jgi:hypothetical protein
VIARLHNFERAADDFAAAGGVESGESFRDHWYIARPDLEQAIAAEGTARTALQVLGLRLHDGGEMAVRLPEDALVVFVSHREL